MYIYIMNIIRYSTIASDVYAVGMSRSWRDRVMDVRLKVCGSLEYLKSVRAAVSQHSLRMLIHSGIPSPPEPAHPSTTPLSPLSSSSSSKSHTSSPYSFPSLQQYQSCWPCLMSSPSPPNNTIPLSMTVTRQDYPLLYPQTVPLSLTVTRQDYPLLYPQTVMQRLPIPRQILNVTLALNC